MTLFIDPHRMAAVDTGIIVRAQDIRTGRWESVDISHLTMESLQAWLRTKPDMAEHVLLLILGYT